MPVSVPSPSSPTTAFSSFTILSSTVATNDARRKKGWEPRVTEHRFKIAGGWVTRNMGYAGLRFLPYAGGPLMARNAILFTSIAVACGAFGLGAPQPAGAQRSQLSAAEQSAALNTVREYALSYTRSLPNFTCIQSTRQMMTRPALLGVGKPGLPISVDLIEEQLSFINHREIRTLVKINDNRPSAARSAQPGTISRGEFGNLLDTIFDPQTRADIRWDRVTSLDRRRVNVFAFHVPQARGYTLVGSKGQIQVPFEGFVYADSQTGTVTRIEMNCSGIPARSEYRSLSLKLNYKATKVAGREYVLPSDSFLRYEMTGAGAVVSAEYKSYRRFSADEKIAFDTDSADVSVAAVYPQPAPVPDNAVAVNREVAPPNYVRPAAEPVHDPAPQVGAAPAEVKVIPPEEPKPPPAPDPVFHAATQLVQVSVIAQDKQGHAVTDLRRDEFQIFDNSAPQEIRLFLADRPDLSPPAPDTPGAFTNRIGSGGASVLLFDKLFIDAGNNVFKYNTRARQKALQALKALPPGDRIAIYSLGCRFLVVREFTSDRDSLLDKLNSFAPAAAPCADPAIPTSGSVLLDRVPEASTMKGHEVEGYNYVAARRQTDLGEYEFKAMADHLAGIPGRKNLIWVTSAFRLSPANVQRLIDANVAIYPVDVIGSMIAPPYAKKERYDPLRAFAAMTGGVAFYDRDDFDAGIREALRDGRVSYTLGFYPASESTNAPVHRLVVRVTRPGVVLRYRTSYELKPEHPVSTNPVEGLVQALNRPVDATAIPVRASATRVQDGLDLAATLDLPSLDLNLSQGLWSGKVEVVARFMTADGNAVGDALAETMTLNLRQTTYESMLRSGVSWHKQMKIPAKAVELKLLVGNLASSRIGTLTIPLSEVKGK
jgi:VWFA-related protein